MRKIIFLIFTIYIIIALSSCSIKNEEKEIYSDVINNYKRDKISIIDSTTIGYDTYGPYEFSNFKKQLNTLELETFEDFIVKNRYPSNIQKNFKSQKNITLMSNVELNKIFENNKDGWQILRNKYGNSHTILNISRVGFNKDKTQALIYLNSSSDWKSGTTYIMLYERKNNNWKECGIILLGMS